MYGNRIRELRKKAGWSQAELALKVGISRPNISFWENSEYPPLEAIVKICNVLKIEVSRFFSEIETEPSCEEIRPETPVQPEFAGLINELESFDEASQRDLLSIFEVIIGKYAKRAVPEEGRHRAVDSGAKEWSVGEMVQYNSINKNRDPYYLSLTARTFGNIAMQEYIYTFL